MIQRIQNLYLFIALVFLLVLTVGSDVFTSFYKEEGQFTILSHGNTFGVQKDIEVLGNLTDENLHNLRMVIDKKEVDTFYESLPTYKFPFYIISGLMALLAIYTIMSYKNLKRQQGLARILFVLNLGAFLASVFLFSSLKESVIPGVELGEVTTRLGTGFYAICIATAFSFMSMLGIKRDRKILSSLDRLR